MMRRHVAVIAAYLLISLIVTFPLVMHFSTHLLGGKFDSYEYVWKIWWVAHALTHGVSPFLVPHIYYPYGYPLAYGEITPAHTFLLLPVTLAFGEIVTYNLSVIGSYVMTGWITFVLARRWLRRVVAQPNERLLTLTAFFSGAVLAFCLYRQQRVLGHVPLFETQWLVLALLGFDLWLETRRLRDATLTALGISLATLSTWYYGFMLALLMPVYALAYGISPRHLLKDRRSWLALGVVALIVGVTCVPFLIPYRDVTASGESFVSVEDAAFWAASPTDYIAPNPNHPLWGGLGKAIVWPFPTDVPAEFVVSVSWTVLVLGLYGSRVTKGRQWRALKWVIAVAFVLSLGPYLHLSRLSLGIPMPVLLLREILPVADSIRSWGRFQLFVTLGFSLLAGAGLLYLLHHLRCPRLRGARRWIGVAVLLLMFAEVWSGAPQVNPVEARPVDHWLAAQDDDAPIMEFPLSVALSGPNLYYTLVHGKPVTFGYGTYLPLIYPKRHPALLTFPGDEALDQLEAWGVHYVLITTDALDAETFTMQAVDAQPRLEHVTTLDGVAVYRLVR